MMADEKVIRQNEHEIRELIGTCLLLVQTVERVIAFTLTFVLQRPNMTVRQLLEQAEKERTRTIGFFLRELRRRADIRPDFDQVLVEFLEKRNTFVHDLSEVPGWDLTSPEGCSVAKQFLLRFFNISADVLVVIGAFARQWAKQANIRVELDDHPILRAIDETYGPLVDQIFSEKTGENTQH